MACSRWFMAGLAALAMGCTGSVPAAGHSSSSGSGSHGSTSTASSSGSGTSSSSTAGSSSSGGSSGTTGSSGSSGGGGAVQAMGCFTDVSPGHHQFSCDGSLTYDVEVPAACASGGCGLVLDVHGLTMNADQEDQGSHMRALGDQYGYVVVQPTAPGAIPSWDPTSTFGPLVFSFVQTAAAAMAVDPHRLHGMGFSQGGGMTWWMICHHADVFASMAPLSAGGVAGCTFLGSDVPSQQIPILDAHGHKDNVVNFQLSAIPQRDAALAYWQFGPGAVFEMDSAHTATRYLTDGGTPFEFYEHDYQAGSSLLGGHCFPGGTDVGPLPDQFGCADPQQFDWGQRAMDFFRAHPRP